MKTVDTVLAAVRPGVSEVPKPAGTDLVAAINQVFAEFELAYHNQFHKAFAAEGSLQLTKKYWLSALGEYSPDLLKRAARQLARTQEFLPTLAGMIAVCEDAPALFGLPAVEAAYREACLAPEPKWRHAWSHAAVYLAAAATGWDVLAGESQTQALPLFANHYAQLCRRVVRGEQLEAPTRLALPEQVRVPLTPERSRARLQALRAQLEL